jgi:hypothetical protein
MFMKRRAQPAGESDLMAMSACCLDNVESSISHSPIGLHSLLCG